MPLTAGFGAAAFGKRFLLYSIGTILLLVVFGALTGLDAPRIAANLPTPWVGVTERINISGYLLWVVVLAITLLRVRYRGLKMTSVGDVILGELDPILDLPSNGALVFHNRPIVTTG